MYNSEYDMMMRNLSEIHDFSHDFPIRIKMKEGEMKQKNYGRDMRIPLLFFQVAIERIVNESVRSLVCILAPVKDCLLKITK